MKIDPLFPFKYIAVLGASSAFMPWFNGVNGSVSGVNLEGLKIILHIDSPFLIFLFPVSFLISAVLMSKKTESIPRFLVKLTEILPLILLIGLTLHIFSLLQQNQIQPITQEGLSSFFKHGFYFGLICSIVLVFAPYPNHFEKTP